MKRFLLLVCLGLFSLGGFALEVPTLTGPVVDLAGAMSSNERARISQVLRSYHQQTQNQLQVLIVKTLEGEPIEGYAIRVAEKWKLGTREKGSGVLMVIAIQDRRMRIEVGEGLEGDLPDAMAARILDHVMAPQFRKGQVAQGIALGLMEIANQLGQPLPDLGVRRVKGRGVRRRGGGSLFFFLMLFLFLGGPRMFGGGRRRGGRGVRSGIWTALILGSMMGGGRRGGFGGGGGFGGWSGGGGGFSGGGASGGW